MIKRKRTTNLPPELDRERAVIKGTATINPEIGKQRSLNELLLVDRQPPGARHPLLHSSSLRNPTKFLKSPPLKTIPKPKNHGSTKNIERENANKLTVGEESAATGEAESKRAKS